MESEEKSLLARILGTATGTLGLATLVIVASVAGGNAYLLYRPNAMEAQAVSAASAPVTGTSASAACQKEIATAAARGTPDVQSTITDASSLQFEDQCVAAVLNPAVTGLGPNNPGSYMCVGKSAKVSVAGVGVVTETAVPDPAVPAGTCATVTCSAPALDGSVSCFAANNVTSLNGNTVESDLAQAQASSISPDSGISSITLNSDGSIAGESANTANVLDTSIGDQGITQSASGISSDLPESGSVVSEASGDSASAIGSAPTVSADAPVSLPEIEVTAPTAPTDVSATADVGDVTSVGSPTVNITPLGTDSAVPSPLPSPTEADSVPVGDPDAPVEPTEPTVTVSNGLPTEVPEAQSNVIERAAATVTRGAISVTNDLLSLMGLPPVGGPTLTPQPETVGIRG